MRSFQKRRILFSVLVAGIFQLSVPSCYADAALAEKVTRVITFSDHQPADRMRTRFLNDVFFKAIEQESNGRLKVDAHWDGEMAVAYDGLNAVSRGKADMATTVPEYTADALPLHQIFKSFPIGPATSKQVSFFQQVYRDVPEFTAEFAKNNVVPIFFATGYPVAFYSTTPMTNLQQIAGQKWRSASFWHLDFLKNTGATPVRMHWGPEIYDAIKSGTIDGLMVNVDSGYFLNVHDVAPYVLVAKSLWLGHVYPVTMNTAVWESLSAADQSAIQRAADKAYEALGTVMEQNYQAQLTKLKQAGATVRELNAIELASFQRATCYESVQANWVARQQKAGVQNAGAVMEKVREVMEKNTAVTKKS